MGFNTTIMQNTPLFKKKMIEVFSKGAESLTLHLPNNCTPKFLPDDRLKRRMLSVLLNSLMEEFSWENKYIHGIHYSHNVKVIVENFDTDYPGTYVFVPSTNELLWIGFRNPSDPFSNLYLQLGDFLVSVNSNAEATPELIHSVMKYGKIYWIRR